MIMTNIGIPIAKTSKIMKAMSSPPGQSIRENIIELNTTVVHIPGSTVIL